MSEKKPISTFETRTRNSFFQSRVSWQEFLSLYLVLRDKKENFLSFFQSRTSIRESRLIQFSQEFWKWNFSLPLECFFLKNLVNWCVYFSCKIRMKVSFIETRTRIFVYQFRVSIRLLCLPNCTYHVMSYNTCYATSDIFRCIVADVGFDGTTRHSLEGHRDQQQQQPPHCQLLRNASCNPLSPPLFLAASFNQRNHHLRVFSGLSLCQILPKCQIHSIGWPSEWSLVKWRS